MGTRIGSSLITVDTHIYIHTGVDHGKSRDIWGYITDIDYPILISWGLSQSIN